MTEVDYSHAIVEDGGSDDPHEQFWQSRKSLRRIRAIAWARMAGPFAVLWVVLARAIAATNPGLQLPGIVGGPGSLNLFVALVGASGGGKDAATAAGYHAVKFVNESGDSLDLPELPLGSGEGLRASYMVPTRPDKDDPNPEPTRIAWRAMFSASEIDGAAAIAARNGSTLMSELRKAWVGATIGAANAGAAFRVVVQAHSYRCCVIAGVQPPRSGVLLNDSDGGTPQRWGWGKVSDLYAPEDISTVGDVTPLEIFVPTISTPTTIELPPVAENAIREHRRAVLTEQPGINPLDSHRLFLQAKIAAAFAILEGRVEEINEGDWALAAKLLSVSDRARAQCEQALAETARKANRAKAHATAEREEMIGDNKLRRARDAITRWLAKGPAAGWEVRRKLKADIRDQFSAAIAELIDSQQIVECEAGGKPAYALVGAGTRDSGTLTDKMPIYQREHDEDSGTPPGTQGLVTVTARVPESLESPACVPEKVPSTSTVGVRVPESRVPRGFTKNSTDATNRARAKILQLLAGNEEMSPGQLRDRMGITDARVLEEAIASLRRDKLMEIREDGSKTRYRLPDNGEGGVA